MSKEEVVAFIKEEIATLLDKRPEDIDDDTNFLKVGISSIQALKIINRARRKLGVDISPVAMFEYKTISEFGGYLSECMEQEII